MPILKTDLSKKIYTAFVIQSTEFAASHSTRALVKGDLEFITEFPKIIVNFFRSPIPNLLRFIICVRRRCAGDAAFDTLKLLLLISFFAWTSWLSSSMQSLEHSFGNPCPFASFTHFSCTRVMTWISYLEKVMTSYTIDMTWIFQMPII